MLLDSCAFGKSKNPEELALNLMNSSSEHIIKAIREALKVVARGVNLKLYKAELYSYKIPA